MAFDYRPKSLTLDTLLLIWLLISTCGKNVLESYLRPWPVWLSGLSTGQERKTGRRFESWWGHMPGLWARSPVEGWIDVSLSFSLPPPLSIPVRRMDEKNLKRKKVTSPTASSFLWGKGSGGRPVCAMCTSNQLCRGILYFENKVKLAGYTNRQT